MKGFSPHFPKLNPKRGKMERELKMKTGFLSLNGGPGLGLGLERDQVSDRTSIDTRATSGRDS